MATQSTTRTKLIGSGSIRKSSVVFLVRPESRLPVALTSGPSMEALTELAEALDLPETQWKRGPDGLYFTVDTRAPDRVKS